MLTVALIVELVFVISFPLALGAWLQRRFQVSWLLFAAGAVTFGLSQAVHLPLNEAIFALAGQPSAWTGWAVALVLGATAGLCEETARYVAYRWVLRDLRQWREALMFGAGHGGSEAIVLVGLVVAAGLLNMTALRGAALEAWGLPAAQTAQLQGQVEAYWAQTWTTPLLAAVERLFTIIFHVGMAALVLQAVNRRRPGYWLLAVGLHTASNALAVLTSEAGWPLAAIEGVIGLFALLALGIILASRPSGPATLGTMPATDATLPPLPVPRQQPLTAEERLRRQIEQSKYE